MGWVAFMGLTMVWATAGHAPSLPDLSRYRATLHASGPAFPPVPRRSSTRLRAQSIAATALDRQIAALGRRPPRYPDGARRGFAETPDLMRYALSLAPAAVSGDGRSAYLIY